MPCPFQILLIYILPLFRAKIPIPKKFIQNFKHSLINFQKTSSQTAKITSQYSTQQNLRSYVQVFILRIYISIFILLPCPIHPAHIQLHIISSQYSTAKPTLSLILPLSLLQIIPPFPSLSFPSLSSAQIQMQMPAQKTSSIAQLSNKE